MMKTGLHLRQGRTSPAHHYPRDLWDNGPLFNR